MFAPYRWSHAVCFQKSYWFQGKKKIRKKHTNGKVLYGIWFTHSRNVLIEFRWDTGYDFFAVTTFYMFYMYPKKSKSHHRQYAKTKPKPPRNIHAHTYKYIGNSNMIYFPPRWFAINEALCTSNGVCCIIVQCAPKAAMANDMKFEANQSLLVTVLPQLAHIHACTHTHRSNHMNEQHRKRENRRIFEERQQKRHTTNVLATHNLRICVCVCCARSTCCIYFKHTDTRCVGHWKWASFHAAVQLVNEHNKAPRELQCNIQLHCVFKKKSQT